MHKTNEKNIILIPGQLYMWKEFVFKDKIIDRADRITYVDQWATAVFYAYDDLIEHHTLNKRYVPERHVIVCLDARMLYIGPYMMYGPVHA